MKKVLLLAIIFSFVLIAPTALATEIQTPAYKEVLRDWYDHCNDGDIHGWISNTGEVGGTNYYSKSIYLFSYVLTNPDGTQQILKEINWDTGAVSGSECINNPYMEAYDQRHYYSQIDLPQQIFNLNPTISGKYKLELKQIRIPAILTYKNPKEKYNYIDILDVWAENKVNYYTYYSGSGTTYSTYLCYKKNPEGSITLFSSYNTPCNNLNPKMEFVNENNLCKWVYGKWYDKNCWIEISQLKKIKVSDLGSNVVWSAEFNAVAPAPEDIGATAINPFSQSKGNSEKKNSGNNGSGNNSNSQNLFPILAVGAVAGSVYLASRPGNRIIIKNFRAGFTEYGLAQIERTKKFFEFLQWEREGGWVKKWKAEEEARARLARERELKRQREDVERLVEVQKNIFVIPVAYAGYVGISLLGTHLAARLATNPAFVGAVSNTIVNVANKAGGSVGKIINPYKGTRPSAWSRTVSESDLLEKIKYEASQLARSLSGIVKNPIGVESYSDEEEQEKGIKFTVTPPVPILSVISPTISRGFVEDTVERTTGISVSKSLKKYLPEEINIEHTVFDNTFPVTQDLKGGLRIQQEANLFPQASFIMYMKTEKPDSGKQSNLETSTTDRKQKTFSAPLAKKDEQNEEKRPLKMIKNR